MGGQRARDLRFVWVLLFHFNKASLVSFQTEYVSSPNPENTVSEGLGAGILCLAQLQHPLAARLQQRPGKATGRAGLAMEPHENNTNPGVFQTNCFEASFWKAGKAAGFPGRLLQVCSGWIPQVGGFNDGQLPDKDKVLLFQGLTLPLCRA